MMRTKQINFPIMREFLHIIGPFSRNNETRFFSNSISNRFEIIFSELDEIPEEQVGRST